MGLSSRPLWLLTAGVTLAHFLLLGTHSANELLQPAPVPIVSLETRTIVPAQMALPKPAGKAAVRSRAVPQAPAEPAAASPSFGALQAVVPAAQESRPEPATKPDKLGDNPSVPVPPQVPAQLAPARVPASVTLLYEVQGVAKGFNYQAGAELDFQHDGKRYEARWTVGAFLMGSRVDASQGGIGPAGLEPLRYSQKTRSERAAHFQRDTARITFSSNKPEAALLPGAQDRLSVLLQLAAWMAADAKLAEAGQVLRMQVVSADRAEPWVFKVEGLEVLSLPAGSMQAVKLQRLPQGEYGQRIEVWLAPQLHFLPVRLRITNSNGDMADQLLRNTQR